jgi:hypothetical protein
MLLRPALSIATIYSTFTYSSCGVLVVFAVLSHSACHVHVCSPDTVFADPCVLMETIDIPYPLAHSMICDEGNGVSSMHQ